VAYTHTLTMFGGYRKWFACPACRSPARILYGINTLRCQRCRGLKYAFQSEASHWRAQRKTLSIRRRVGASSNALDEPFPPKPPKMRSRHGLSEFGARGELLWNVDPLPSVDTTQIRPPCISTICLAMARPSLWPWSSSCRPDGLLEDTILLVKGVALPTVGTSLDGQEEEGIAFSRLSYCPAIG
jgi:hypothetical protein